VQLVAVVLVARDPMALAHFWQSALRWDLRAVDRLGVMLVSTDETSFHFLVQAGAGEKIGQNRIHFDLTTARTPLGSSGVKRLAGRSYGIRTRRPPFRLRLALARK
jgi:hypothetical protein